MAFNAPKSAMLAILRAYKFAISPLFPPSCRYVPTCSEYAVEAIDRHGVIRGSLMAVWRVLRCHPFVKGGFDPVPLGNSVPTQDRRTAGVLAAEHAHESASH